MAFTFLSNMKPAVKYSIIIGIPAVILIILIIVIVAIATFPNGKGKGAYLSVPDPTNLEYRFGSGGGLYGNGWDDAKAAILGSMAGADGARKKLPEKHLVDWGYGIELGDCKVNTQHGILDVIGYLATPTKAHSSNATGDSELCYPANLYEDIWLDKNTVNPKNYWANYVYKTVSTYKDYIKIWETWNEPDYTDWRKAGDWNKNPPNPKDLYHWYGSIFAYIRLLRITYEVAKKVDPTCWVATGGLGYGDFLDGILRYTDNPKDGSVTRKYPAYGGAYFDCDAYHQYPIYGTTDLETGISYNGVGSDSLAKKVVILKKSHHFIIKKYGFGSKYPDKIFVNTETGVTSTEKNKVGGDLVRRNWLLKIEMYAIEYDVKQIHLLNLVDDEGYGDFYSVGTFVSLEEAFKKIKPSTKGRITLKSINIGKFIFDKEKSKKLRESLPTNVTGIVLKRKFPKEENETYYADYIYSFWRYCDNEEVSGEIELQLNLPFDPLFMDWLKNEKKILKNDHVKISSTPIFLLGNFTEKPSSKNSGTSGFVIFLGILGVIILVVIVAFVGLYCYKRFVKKKDIPFDKNILSSLLH